MSALDVYQGQLRVDDQAPISSQISEIDMLLLCAAEILGVIKELNCHGSHGGPGQDTNYALARAGAALLAEAAPIVGRVEVWSRGHDAPRSAGVAGVTAASPRHGIAAASQPGPASLRAKIDAMTEPARAAVAGARKRAGVGLDA